MSDKMECPGCGGYSSTVLGSFDRGESCAFCGLPWSAAAAVIEVREKRANDEVTAMAEAALVKAGRHEQQAQRFVELVEALRELLDRFSESPEENR